MLQSHYVALFESENFTENDLRVNIAKYQQRVQWAELAKKRDALREAAEKAEKLFNDEDLKEGRRQRDAHKKLQELEYAVEPAIAAASKATAAEGNLIAQAVVSPKERLLNAQSTELNEAVARLRCAVDETFHSTDSTGHSIGLAGDWASIQEFPALLAAQTKRTLKDEIDILSAERKTQLKGQLVATERAVAKAEKELTRLEKQQDTINKQRAEFAAAKLLPESFEIVRARPSHDQEIKKHAYELGFHGGSGVTIKTGK